MKTSTTSLKWMAAAALLVLNVACSKSVESGDDDGNGYDYSDLISSYVDKVVIPTYADMKDKSWILYDRVNIFSSEPTQRHLEAVCEAWLDVRAPWELSEAFLYGPCGENGLNVDPNIDTWPFDMGEFTGKINGGDPLTVEAVSGYTETTRGFHTIEYLIFRDGNPKNITDTPLNAREMQYLVSATTVLRNDCIRIWAAWRGVASGIGDRDKEAIEEMKTIGYWDVESYLSGIGVGSYSETFKNVKRPYTSQTNVVEEIIDGCREIATEVSENKIETPYREQDVTKVESHYAYNSLVDFTNNIVSIENAYYGNCTGAPSENSLSAFVRSQEGGEAIDTELKAALVAAKEKINRITYPFTNNLNDKTNIEAAVEACADVDRVLLKIKTLL